MNQQRERRRSGREAAPERLAEQLGRLEVVVCCGSGGVGKTTVSAALGAAIASEWDKRVLVLTIDPARRLATALGMQGIGSDPVKVSATRLRQAGIPLRGELVAAMLDQKSAWDQLVQRYAPNRATADRIVQSRFYKGISDAFVGSHEYMAMESLFELHQAGEYDCMVVDTPPSRNALDFLEAPERIADFIGARLLSWLARPSGFGFRALNFAASPFLHMADRLVGSEVLSELRDFVTDLQTLYSGVQQSARAVSRLLRSSRVGFVVVSTLEPEAFAEAEFFISKLHQFSMPLRALVLNRVLPDVLRDDAARRVAETLAENGRVAARLATALEGSVDAAACAGLGRSYRVLADLAYRDAHQLGRLRQLRDVAVARIPLITDPVSELEGLARVAASL